MREGLDALYQRNDPARAAELFGAVLFQNATHYGASFQLAVALERSGRAREALAQYGRMRELAVAASDRETIGLVDARVAQLQTSPDMAMAEGTAALYERRDAREAVRLFRRVLEMQPSHYGANFQLAAALQAAGDRDAARQAYLRALAMARNIRDVDTIRLIESRLGQLGD